MSTQSNDEWPSAKQQQAETHDWAGAIEAEANADNEPVEVHILDRNGDPYRDAEGEPAVIFALGLYSDAVKAFDRAQRRKINKASRAGKRIRTDDEEIERSTAERLAAATTGWRLAIHGAAVPFNRANAITLYTTAEWVADQVWAGVRAHADFFEEKSAD